MALTTHDDGAVRIITLNRPEVRNALNPMLRDALYDAFEAAAEASHIAAVVLTGTGKAFCAGLDLAELKSLSQRSSEENRRDSAALAKLLERIYRFPKPVVAALNGHAIAGGAGLASVCDVVVMSDSAKFGYTESRIGFVAALVGVFLLRQVGERKARDLLLSARLLEAQEAQTMGLVNQICPSEQVLPEALRWARLLASNAPSSLTFTKDLLTSLPGMGLQESLRYAIDLNALSRSSQDLQEGIQAFLEKRDPKWQR